jgi:hypothetical protein
MSNQSAQVWRLNSDSVLSANHIAQALIGASSLNMADLAVVSTGRPSELGYERVKARRLATLAQIPDVERAIDVNLAGIEEATRDRGADFVTLRRLAELLQLPSHALPSMWTLLRARSPERYFPPVWAVHPHSENTVARAACALRSSLKEAPWICCRSRTAPSWHSTHVGYQTLL